MVFLQMRNTIIFYHLFLSNTVSFQFYKFFMEKILKKFKVVYLCFKFLQFSKDNRINETLFY